MVLREVEDNAYAKFWVTNKEHLMVCYGIFLSGQLHFWAPCRNKRIDVFIFKKVTNNS